MPLGLRHPADSMWMLRLWKWGSPPVSLPFVLPPALASDLLSILLSVCLCLPPILAHLCFPLLPFIHSWQIPSPPPPPHSLTSIRNAERAGVFPAFSPDVLGAIAIPHHSEESLTQRNDQRQNYSLATSSLCLGQTCLGFGHAQ